MSIVLRAGCFHTVYYRVLSLSFQTSLCTCLSILVSNEQEHPGTHTLRTNTQASFTVTPMTLWSRSHSSKFSWPAQWRGHSDGPWAPAGAGSFSPLGEETMLLSRVPVHTARTARLAGELVGVHQTDLGRRYNASPVNEMTRNHCVSYQAPPLCPAFTLFHPNPSNTPPSSTQLLAYSFYDLSLV